VLQTSDRSQTAVMTLEPDRGAVKRSTNIRASEQILLVLEGEVVAEIGEQRDVLHAGDVVIVPPGAVRRFGNESSKSSVVTFNVYVPPAY